MQVQPIISIVIPTYNRYMYLKGCIEATLSIDSECLEVIVQDNTEDNSEILPFLESITDDRLKYYHISEHMTVSDNCNIAIEKASGEYICLIGDDDTVCANIVELATEMKKNEIDTCVFGICKYNWPDLKEMIPELNGFESPHSAGTVIYKDTLELLHTCLGEGVQTISILPRVYHAIASRYVLSKIKEKAGTYFPGPSPDMANAMGCLLYSRKHIQTDIPVMISGYGGSSAGGLGKRKLHKGSLKGKSWLPKNIEEIWDPKIPRLWMGNTIWPASAVVALKSLERADLLAKLNYGVIYAETVLHDFSSIKEIMSCHLSLSEFCTMIKHGGSRIMKKCLKKGIKKTPLDYCAKESITIIEAKNIQEQLNNKNPHFVNVFCNK